MGKPQYAILGAALLLLAGIGVWVWSRTPATPATAPSSTQQLADLHARALLRVVVTRADRPADDPEVRWLESEIRYLLMRAQVALARPQGPFDPEDGTALFTLRVAAGTRPGDDFTLSLLTPDEQIERTASVKPASTSRLGLLTAVAGRLPSLLPRGDTGVKLEPFLGTDNADAYETFAQAQMAAFDKSTIPQAGIAASNSPIDRLEMLTKRRPAFARAWAELALLYLRINGRDAASLAANAERAARKALALDAKLADAHAALGIAQQRRGEWLTADASLSQALVLDPASPWALEAFSCLLSDVGRTRYANLIGEQAVTVAPASALAGECLGYSRLAAGESLDSEEGQPQAGPATRPRALAALMNGRIDEARSLLEGGAASPAQFDSWFASVAGALREPDLRPQALRAITQAASEGTLDPVTEILFGVALRQPDFVFNRLLRLRKDGAEAPTRLLWIKEAAYLREHPRFATVAEMLGLKAYWKDREQPDVCTPDAELAICASR